MSGFGSASTSSQYLAPHWMKRLLEDCEGEENVAGSWSVRTLDGPARDAVWTTCARLGVRRAGVAAQACRLLERYLTLTLHTGIHELGVRDEFDETWLAYKRSLCTRLPLMMMSCLKLAGKMNSSCVQLSAEKIRVTLLSYGHFHSLSEVIDAEFQVFRTLKFRVPLWTSVEAAELLAQEVHLPRSAFCLIPYVVDYAEYNRDVIESSADLPLTATATLRTLHLAAGAVAAVAQLTMTSASWPGLLPRLAQLVRAPPSLLDCVCKLIVDRVHEPANSDASTDSS